MSACRFALGEGVNNGSTPKRTRCRSARDSYLQGQAICVSNLSSQLDIKRYRLIFTKPDDRLFTKRHGDIQLSPARRFLFCRFYVC